MSRSDQVRRQPGSAPGPALPPLTPQLAVAAAMLLVGFVGLFTALAPLGFSLLQVGTALAAGEYERMETLR